jgi:transcriptional regulator with XRE-family HTH domain
VNFQDINTRVAARLGKLRYDRGWSIDHLATRSGVSRAMISKIERANTSPTIAVLNKLSIGFGITLTEFLDSGRYNRSRQRADNPISTRQNQPEWRDSDYGCRRILLTPGSAARSIQLAAVVLPAGGQVALDGRFSEPGIQQQIWVLKGRLDLRIGAEWRLLTAGDCIAITTEGIVTHRNPSEAETRYLIASAFPVRAECRPRQPR